MSRYFLHIRSGVSEALDLEGVEFADMATLRKVLMDSARELMRAGISEGVIDLRFRIDAENSDGSLCCSQPFAGAVTIIAEEEDSSPLR